MLRDEWREPLRALRDPLAATDRRVRARRDRKRQWRKQTWLGRFVSTYGWRAYALPVLMVLTTVVVYQTVTGTSTPRPAAAQTVRDSPAIGVVGTAILDAPPRGLAVFDANLPAGTLPDGGPFTEAGDKTWRVVPGTTPQVGQGTVKVFRYTVEIENGLDPTMYGGDNAFAQMVDQTLTNPKGWTPQSAIRVRADRQRKTRLPDFAGVADDSARGVWLRIPARDVLLQPVVRRHGSPIAGVHQRGALGTRSRSIRR